VSPAALSAGPIAALCAGLTVALCAGGCRPSDAGGPAAPPPRGSALASAPAAPTAADAPAPPPAAGAPTAIGFADLSLLGSDVEGLLEALFSPGQGELPAFEYPERARSLAGREVEIVGYMIPLDYAEGGGVTEFMLVRDLASCCFGGMPRPDEWIHATSEAEEGAGLVLYRPIVARGVLAVGLERVDDGFLSSAYQLRAREVTAR